MNTETDAQTDDRADNPFCMKKAPTGSNTLKRIRAIVKEGLVVFNEHECSRGQDPNVAAVTSREYASLPRYSRWAIRLHQQHLQAKAEKKAITKDRQTASREKQKNDHADERAAKRKKTKRTKRLETEEVKRRSNYVSDTALGYDGIVTLLH